MWPERTNQEEEDDDPADMYDQLELMGEGRYGKVMKCLNKETGEIVALKAMKICENTDYVVAKEVFMLDKVSTLDPDADNIIRFNKYFKSTEGLHCMEFELLDLSIRLMAKNLLISLQGLRRVGVIHTDVKPDNVMYVDQQNEPFRVKLIDFGVATLAERAKTGKIMQPIAYRAPEVTLGLPLSEAVDMWSLGCCLLEWYLSFLPFPADSPYDHLKMITHLMGVPHGELLKQAILKEVSEYTQTTGVTPKMDVNPLQVFKDLKDVIQNYHKSRSGLDFEDRTFLDLLQKMFNVDPDKRITPAEALRHSFIIMTSGTEMPSTSTYGIDETPENAHEESDFASSRSKRSDGQAVVSTRSTEKHQRPNSPVTVRPASIKHDCQGLHSPEVTPTSLNVTTISRTPGKVTEESEIVIRNLQH
uniref:Protein kinase domain-containing protein n=1 Tax=Neogobius melanostomus TaxID=47308 RepID=A0A8C6T2W2_9GOBI